MNYDLCRACAEELKAAYDLKKIAGGIDNKITCAHCQRKRYGATYEMTKRKREDKT